MPPAPPVWVTWVIEISVVVPTRNRLEKLNQTLSSLAKQTLDPARYEVLVVDDGSEPPIQLPTRGPTERFRVLRIMHGERSAARNHGATVATGEFLAFVDDDMILAPVFLEAHRAAQRQWPGALAVGAVSLPEEVVGTPFGRFRADLETRGVPHQRGVVIQPNFCTATNMSLSKEGFLALGGFDPDLVSAEDQDLALRHSARGGAIVFIPEAVAIHNDHSLDIRSYCRRAEWGAENMMPFCQHHPDLTENRLRAVVNGPVRWRTDSASLVLKKLLKSVLGSGSVPEILFALTGLVERVNPSSRVLSWLYQMLLGVHLQRGFRRGWTKATDRRWRG